MITIAFLNPPFWSLEDTANPNEKRLRRGIRAGSRWPFTTPASRPAGSANCPVGEYLPFPMFLASAAAWTQRALPDAKVILRDSIARYESYEEFDNWWHDAKPDCVILETGAASAEHDLRYIQAMKKSNPKLRVALAGPPTKTLYDKFEWYHACDAGILGEFEKGSVDFANGKNGLIPFNLLTKEELATSPYPMFDEEVAATYCDANPKGATMPELTVWGSRSCTYRCSFCAWPATMTNDDSDGTGKRSFRFYSPEWLEGFIRHRIQVFGQSGKPLKSIRWDDDTANGGNKHTAEICGVMRRIGLPWSAMCRADTVNRETWQMMKDSGCFGVKLGFESGSQRVIDELIHKHLDLQKAADTARFIRSIGMTVHGTFAIGSPGESAEERQETIAFIQTLISTGALDTYQLSGMAEIPGTPLANLIHNDPDYVKSPDGALKAEQLLAK